MTRIAWVVCGWIACGLGCGSRSGGELDLGDPAATTAPIAITELSHEATCDPAGNGTASLTIVARYTNVTTEPVTFDIERAVLMPVDRLEPAVPLALATQGRGFIGPGDVRTLTHASTGLNAHACGLCGALVIAQLTVSDSYGRRYAVEGEPFYFTCRNVS